MKQDKDLVNKKGGGTWTNKLQDTILYNTKTGI